MNFRRNLPIIVKLAIPPVGPLLLMAVLAVVVTGTLTRTDTALDHLISAVEQKSSEQAKAQRAALSKSTTRLDCCN